MFAARLILCLTLALLPVRAAVSAPADNTTIVVTAQDRKQLHNRITTFVRTATIVPELGQYARRNSAYCPKVVGLAAEHIPRVLDRVRDAGRAAGLPEPRARCQANLTIIFTENGDAQMAVLRKRSTRLFVGSYREKERELFGSGRAIRWWYASDLSAAQGGPVGTDVADGIPAEGGTSSGIPGFGGMRTQKTYTASLIETSITVDLVGTFVVIDVTKANGIPLDGVASFAAMVSFAQINGKQDFAGFPSILSLFANDTGNTRPTELTQWDKAYLHALYTIPPNREAWVQRSRLTGKMLQRLKP